MSEKLQDFRSSGVAELRLAEYLLAESSLVRGRRAVPANTASAEAEGSDGEEMGSKSARITLSFRYSPPSRILQLLNSCNS